jgi:hypothetical protein
LLDVQLKPGFTPRVQARVAVNRQALQQAPEALGMTSVSNLNVSTVPSTAAPQAAPVNASAELAKYEGQG